MAPVVATAIVERAATLVYLAAQAEKDLIAEQSQIMLSQAQDSMSWLDSAIQTATQAKLALLVSAAVYGLSYVVSKDLQDNEEFGIKPGVLNGIRFFLASSLFLSDLIQSVSSMLSERLFPKRNQRILSNGFSLLRRDQQQRALIAGLELGLWASLGFLAQSLALQSSTASKVSFFSGLTVVVTPLIAYLETVWLAIKRKLLNPHGDDAVIADNSIVSPPSFLSSLSNWMAPCLAVAGAAVLELGDQSSSSTASSSGLSNIYLVLTPLAFGIWFHRSETLAAAAKTAAAAMERSPEKSSHSSGSVYTRVVTGSMLLIAALVSYIYSFFMECGGGSTSPGLWMLFQSRKVAIPMVMFIGVVATGWTALVEQLALRCISASDVSLIYTLEPLFATAFAFFLLGEEIGISTILGALLIISACVVGAFNHH